MNLLADRSVHLVVTSPPYWQLKDYGTENQIGFHESYESYINNLNLVWSECERVLHPGCRLCINIGDQFARSVYYGRYKVIPIRTEIIKFCETIGFDYMGAVIWQKVTTTNTTGGASIMGSFPYPRKLTFGSRIEKESDAEREEFFTVKEILSPEKVMLSNGLTVKLIGIKGEAFAHDKAVGYLTEKIKGKRIFLKYDKLKHDEENLLLCYLYLENKTFVNAHLIKSGLVGIDGSYEYKQKVKFLTLLEKVNG